MFQFAKVQFSGPKQVKLKTGIALSILSCSGFSAGDKERTGEIYLVEVAFQSILISVVNYTRRQMAYHEA